MQEKQEMESGMTSRRDPGFWRDLWQQTRLTLLLMRDSDVPFYLKLLPFAALIYVVWPLDLLPGIVLDDITAVLVGVKIFIEMSPPHVVARHMQTIREQDGMLKAHDDDIADTIIIDNEDTMIGDDR